MAAWGEERSLGRLETMNQELQSTNEELQAGTAEGRPSGDW
jgi:hypothetical protein